MTQALAVSLFGQTVHVSDRLLSLQGGGVWDRASNKAIAFMAGDALVVVAYSGIAHVSGQATDSWIAAKLAGKTIDEAYRTIGSSGDWPCLGPAFQRLSDGVRDLQVGYPLEVSVNGWMLKRHGGRWRYSQLATWHVSNQGGKGLAVHRAGRHMDWRRRYAVSVIPPMSQPTLSWLRPELRAHVAEGPEVAEALLLEAVRREADIRSTVGKDCMAIRLVPGFPSNVEITFYPWDSTGADEAYGPWILCDGYSAPPSIMSPGAGWTIQPAGLTYTVQLKRSPGCTSSSEATENKVLFEHRQQPRKPAPGS